MTFSKKTIGIGVLALGLFIAAGLTANAGSGGRCGSKATTTAGSVTCTDAQKAACGATKTTSATMVSNSGGCGSATSATMASGSACCASKGVKTTMADAKLPEGTKMTRVEVPGGIDVIFTGKDLTGIQSFLNAHAGLCSENDKNCPRTCAVSATDNSVVLSVRGENPDQCCVGVMTAEATAKPAGDSKKAEKVVSKKS